MDAQHDSEPVRRRARHDQEFPQRPIQRQRHTHQTGADPLESADAVHTRNRPNVVFEVRRDFRPGMPTTHRHSDPAQLRDGLDAFAQGPRNLGMSGYPSGPTKPPGRSSPATRNTFTCPVWSNVKFASSTAASLARVAVDRAIAPPRSGLARRPADRRVPPAWIGLGRRVAQVELPHDAARPQPGGGEVALHLRAAAMLFPAVGCTSGWVIWMSVIPRWSSRDGTRSETKVPSISRGRPFDLRAASSELSRPDEARDLRHYRAGWRPRTVESCS